MGLDVGRDVGPVVGDEVDDLSVGVNVGSSVDGIVEGASVAMEGLLLDFSIGVPLGAVVSMPRKGGDVGSCDMVG